MKGEAEAQRFTRLGQGVPKSQVIRNKPRTPDVVSMLPKIKECELRKQCPGPSSPSLSFYRRGNRDSEEWGLLRVIYRQAGCTINGPKSSSFVLAVTRHMR